MIVWYVIRLHIPLTHGVWQFSEENEQVSDIKNEKGFP